MRVSANFSSEHNQKVLQFIIGQCVKGKPKRGTMKEASQKFKISSATCTRWWSAAKKQRDNGKTMQIINGKQTSVRKKLVLLDLTLLQSLAYTKRGTIRSLAVGLQCSKSTVGRWVKSGLIRVHTSAIRPDLTAPNKLLRIRFTLEALELDRIQQIIKFKDMHNTIHIDEKWFYITKGTHRFYLAPGEVEPHRSCQNKKFIGKIMFMCAVARPLFGENGEVLFDGKIDIFLFTGKVPAKRNSKNRRAGTIETKPIESITKAVTKECVINKIIPAIMSKWPHGACKQINIQQDNARPHIQNNDIDFMAAANQNGFTMNLVQQTPNSPDTNVNDLGWFRAIQSLQLQTTCNTLDDLVKAVEKSFQDLCPITLDNVFMSLQGCMIEIMKVKGKNSYKIPHKGKSAQRRMEQLPPNLQVPTSLAADCIAYLTAQGCNEGIQMIAQCLGLEHTV